MGKPFSGVWFQYQDTYGNNVDPGPALQAQKFTSGDDEIWWYPLGPGDVNSLTAISLKVMLASDSPTVAMKNVKYLDLYADDSRDALFDDDEILDFTGSLGGKKTPLYFLYDIETAENQSDDDEGNSSVTTGKRDKGPSQYGVWFKFEDTYGNNVDPGSWYHSGKFKSGDDEIWWYELSPDQVNSLTAISFKILLVRQGDGGWR
ncbi:hypothetical protein BDZ97DRAFT_107456 [Flammula alnicola]|nr:hypothetical protein BDZ97DRAFT_107456 [Flammula alnicola]